MKAKYLKLSVNAVKVRHVLQCLGASCRPNHITPLQVQFQPIEVRSVVLFIIKLVIIIL